MLECTLCLAAKGVVRDAETGAISVFSILESVGGEGFPLLLQEAYVLSIWVRGENDPQTYDLDFVVKNNRSTLVEGDIRIDFEDTKRNRAISKVSGIVLQEPGVLRFGLTEQEGRAEAEYEIPVTGPPTEVAVDAGVEGE